MASALEAALQKALSIRLNLQISLSQLPIIEEWMDIHLDRWLEHNPTPTELPDGADVSYLAMLGSDLRRMWWGAWGDPRGFVPKLADYFKLCNIARSDASLLDQMGEQLEPRAVGSWIGVWAGKVITGWHFCDPQPWPKIETMFGTHDAKYRLKKWVEDHGVERIERFVQAIGDAAFSELELALPGESAEQQVSAASAAFAHLTGAPLDAALMEQLRTIPQPGFGLAVRIRSGAIARVAVLAPGVPQADLAPLCAAARVQHADGLPKMIGALGGHIVRVDYGRAGDRAGVDVFLEPGDAAPRQPLSAPSEAN
jgi:hypothetical protein